MTTRRHGYRLRDAGQASCRSAIGTEGMRRYTIDVFKGDRMVVPTFELINCQCNKERGNPQSTVQSSLHDSKTRQQYTCFCNKDINR